MAKTTANDWPLPNVSVARHFVIALGTPLIFLQAAEVFTRLASRNPAIWPNVFRCSEITLGFGLFLACLLSMRMGWRGLAFGAIATFAVFHLAISYRGTFIWPGTFDLFEVKHSGWTTALFTSAILGMLAGAITFRGRLSTPPRWQAYAATAALFLSAIWSGFITTYRVAEPLSEFGPTRHWAYLVLATTCLVLLTVLELKNEA